MNEVKGYELVNAEKVNRALNGFQKNDGTIIGGIGKGAYRVDGVWKREDTDLNEKEVEELESALLAEYDRLGGFIRKNGDKIKTGSFYNIKAKKPLAVPNIFYIYKVGSRFVEVPEGKELPGEVKAVKILTAQLDEEKAEKVSKRAKKSLNI